MTPNRHPDNRHLNYVRGIIGAAAGGIVGCLAFWLLVRRGLHAPILPFGVIGLGCGLLSRRRDLWLGALSAGLGLVVTIVADWLWWPFKADPSFGYFITHLHRQDPMVLLGIPVSPLLIYVIGATVAFWFGMGRNRLSYAEDSVKEESQDA